MKKQNGTLVRNESGKNERDKNGWILYFIPMKERKGLRYKINSKLNGLRYNINSKK